MTDPLDLDALRRMGALDRDKNWRALVAELEATRTERDQATVLYVRECARAERAEASKDSYWSGRIEAALRDDQ